MFHEPTKPVKPVKKSMSNDQLLFVGSYRFLFGVALLLLLAFALLLGCENSGKAKALDAPATPVAKNKVQETIKRQVVVDLMDDSSETQEEATPESEAKAKAKEGMLRKATELFGKAKEKSGETATGATQWVQDKLSGAADVSGKTAEDTMEWANETYQSLKDKGLTTAKDTSEWLGQDYSNMESWEYKVTTLSGSDEELSAKLNELGKEGWDCINAESVTESSTRFYLKKPTFSYMRHLPFKDVIKLIPMMGGEEEK